MSALLFPSKTTNPPTRSGGGRKDSDRGLHKHRGVLSPSSYQGDTTLSSLFRSCLHPCFERRFLSTSLRFPDHLQEILRGHLPTVEGEDPEYPGCLIKLRGNPGKVDNPG
jgi:hypothetical protein